MKLNLIRRSDFSFVPATDEDMEKALKIKKGQAVECSVKVLRNYKLLKKFWAMINTAFNFLSPAQREFFHDSVDGFRCTIEVAAGYYDEFYDVTRRAWIQKPKSIAFDKMGEAEFGKLYEDVVNVVFKIFLPHVDRDEFYQAMKDF
jgi:hypothetical protein